MHGPTYIFWANLTPFSLQAESHWHEKEGTESSFNQLRHQAWKAEWKGVPDAVLPVLHCDMGKSGWTRSFSTRPQNLSEELCNSLGLVQSLDGEGKPLFETPSVALICGKVVLTAPCVFPARAARRDAALVRPRGLPAPSSGA